MSLINKMLQDLESRRGGGDDGLTRLVSGQLRPSAGGTPRRSYRFLWGGLAVAVVVGAAGLSLIHGYRNRGPVPAPVRPAATVPTERKPVTAAHPPAEKGEPASGVPVAQGKVHAPSQAESSAVASKEAALPATPPEAVHSTGAAQVTAKTARRRAHPADARFEKVPRHLTVAQQSDQVYRDAVRDLQNRHTSAAVKKLNTALALDPANMDARELLAGVLLRQGNEAGARTLLEEGHSRALNYLPFTMMLAHLYLDGGDAARALSLLEAARDTAGDDPDYLAFLGAMYERAGHNGKAAQAYSQAVAARPQAATWWLGLGIALEADKQWADARRAYQRARNTRRLTPDLDRYAATRLAALKNK